jgi:hypothetical protein
MTKPSKTEPGVRQLSTTEIDAVAGASLLDVVREIYRFVTAKGPQL